MLKAETLHSLNLNKIDEFCPEKIRKIAFDNQPFITDRLKTLDRKRRREYRKNMHSPKYKKIQKIYKKKDAEGKKKFKQNIIDDVIVARSSQWYSKMKRISNYEQNKSDSI